MDAVIAEAKPAPPAPDDIPPYIKECLKHGAARAVVTRKQREGQQPTADELVAANLQKEDERNACTAKLLNWYQTQQRIRKQREKASAKVAAAK